MMSAGDILDRQSLLIEGLLGGGITFGLVGAGMPVLAAATIGGCVGLELHDRRGRWYDIRRLLEGRI